LVFVVGSGVVHGLWTGRWQKPVALEVAVARVTQVPLVIGDWHGKDIPVDAREFAQAGAESYWARTYTDKNRSVTVLLMCGQVRHMAVHTPEVCYQGLGFQMVDVPENIVVPYGPARDKAEFWTARFTRQLGFVGDLRLFWAWNGSGTWQAPTSPRWTYAGQPFLYKLYVVEESTAPQRLENDAAVMFLGQFLPVAKAKLFPGEGPVGRIANPSE
jgi:hypothetical protein